MTLSLLRGRAGGAEEAGGRLTALPRLDRSLFSDWTGFSGLTAFILYCMSMSDGSGPSTCIEYGSDCLQQSKGALAAHVRP